jgi:hypothetical protein
MARFQGFNLLKVGTVGFIGGILLLIVAWIFNTFSIPQYFVSNGWISFTGSVVDVNLRNQVQNAGFVNIVGDAFANLLTLIHLDISTVLKIIGGAILLLFVGRTITGFIPKINYKLVYIVSYLIGGIIGGVFIGTTLGVDVLSTILSLGLLMLIVGIIMQITVNTKKFKYLSD